MVTISIWLFADDVGGSPIVSYIPLKSIESLRFADHSIHHSVAVKSSTKLMTYQCPPSRVGTLIGPATSLCISWFGADARVVLLVNGFFAIFVSAHIWQSTWWRLLSFIPFTEETSFLMASTFWWPIQECQTSRGALSIVWLAVRLLLFKWNEGKKVPFSSERHLKRSSIDKNVSSIALKYTLMSLLCYGSNRKQVVFQGWNQQYSFQVEYSSVTIRIKGEYPNSPLTCDRYILSISSADGTINRFEVLKPCGVSTHVAGGSAIDYPHFLIVCGICDISHIGHFLHRVTWRFNQRLMNLFL